MILLNFYKKYKYEIIFSAETRFKIHFLIVWKIMKLIKVVIDTLVFYSADKNLSECKECHISSSKAKFETFKTSDRNISEQLRKQET